MNDPSPHPSATRVLSRLAPAVALMATLMGCSSTCGLGASATPPVIVASTTSTEDSGLFRVLVPAFEAAHPGHRVAVVAVGTGEALTIGRAGDADVILVHSPEDEELFIREGHGVRRREVMYNDFVLVGPPSDPVGIFGGDDVVAAMSALARAGGSFISRGDDSGTFKKERALWRLTEVDLSEPWYLSIGQGMGQALIMSSEMRAYTITDRGTFLSMRDKLDLAVHVEGDPRLRNQYGVVTVALARNPEGAELFARWLVSDEAQALIGSFGSAEAGEPLFHPNAD